MSPNVHVRPLRHSQLTRGCLRCHEAMAMAPCQLPFTFGLQSVALLTPTQHPGALGVGREGVGPGPPGGRGAVASVPRSWEGAAPGLQTSAPPGARLRTQDPGLVVGTQMPFFIYFWPRGGGIVVP